jgi:pyruvate dehydrogenase (quinone)
LLEQRASGFLDTGTSLPVLIDAVVNRMELAMPPKITAAMAKGFTLFMVKALLSGKADEVVEIARTNLWR